ncbi:hypothetical protein [Candidatus Clostridium radicumherbarum]|uniref:Uncharacterized protein n=1 Tax=Candidatus Clostridium radicumherbarum TaxID=3381662 RepID=A0ABW8TV75_9CLOT
MKKLIFGCTLLIIATMYMIPGAYGLAIPIYVFGFIFVAWGSVDDKRS